MTYNDKFAGKKRWCIVEDEQGLHHVREGTITSESHPSIKFANIEMIYGQVEGVELKNLFDTKELAYLALHLRYGEEIQIGGLENE